MKRRILTFSVLVLMTFAFTSVVSSPMTDASNSGSCNSTFLTFPAWYSGLKQNPYPDCGIAAPTNGISTFIWTIALNIVNDILQVVAYVSAGFVIYGGYLYLISSGLPDKAAAGRKTIINAMVGLVLSFMSAVIVGVVAGNLGK